MTSGTYVLQLRIVKITGLRVRRISRWRKAAIVLYQYAFGNRCIRCSKPVKAKDAVLWHMEGGPEVLLTHRKCKP